MLHELHKAGYQRLRFSAGMSASGLHWRCIITHADNTSANGWEPIDWTSQVAEYSTAHEDRYFDWPDAPGASARKLASMFIERFGDLAVRGTGEDCEYAGWVVSMLGAAENGELPIFFADYRVESPQFGWPPPPVKRVDRAHGHSAIRESGGVLVRFLEALNGFKAKYGYWPTRLEAEAESLAFVMTRSLTPLGLMRMQSRIELVIGDQGTVLALGDAGEVFDYGSEGWQHTEGYDHDAREWLGFEVKED